MQNSYLSICIASDGRSSFICYNVLYVAAKSGERTYFIVTTALVWSAAN